MTKIASTKPAYCSCCYGQPDARYVDFEAAYDGPVIPGNNGPVPIDDLIVCEGCLAEAFSLLDPQGMRQTIEELTQMLRDTQETLDAKDRVIQGLRKSTTELIDHPVAKFPGKPRLEGVPDEVREELTRNMYRRRGSSPDPTKKKVPA